MNGYQIISERSIEETLGTQNVDSKRIITIDSINSIRDIKTDFNYYNEKNSSKRNSKGSKCTTPQQEGSRISNKQLPDDHSRIPQGGLEEIKENLIKEDHSDNSAENNMTKSKEERHAKFLNNEPNDSKSFEKQNTRNMLDKF